MSSGTVTPSRVGAWGYALRRRRSGRPAAATLWTGVGLIALVLLASAVGHFVLPDPNQQDLLAPLQAPSPDHLFGTDELGRDVLSRTLAATWLDLPLALAVTYASVVLGVVAGTAAGYFRGWVDRVVMRLTDVAIAIPSLVLTLAIIAIVGPGIKGLFIAFISFGWAFYARFARAEMLVLRERQFMQAAQTLGFSNRRVMLRHAVPNLLRPVIVYSTSDIVAAIVLIATLSFLGLGVPPPTPEWGAIIESGQSYLLTAWWITTLPGVVVLIVGLGFCLIGDALAERFGGRRELVAE